MKRNIDLHIWRILPILLISSILSIAGCRDASSVSRRLDAADRLMELRPDSSLIILDSIQPSALNERGLKARYALLKSMALDKNYVDTTTFDILQPAIDYYLEKGTPDEKLRTYYYQGRIFQNRNERDSALHSFMRALDITGNYSDSLTMARILVVQGIIYKSFYDIERYTDNYLTAADIYRSKAQVNPEFNCLTSALNGLNMLKDKHRADSVISILGRFDSQNERQKQLLHSLRLTYIYQFGSKTDIRNLIENNNDSLRYDVNGILNLAMAYGRLGDYDKAIQQLDYLDEAKVEYDTLKYLSIKYPILENLSRYEEALAVYKNLVDRLETINSSKFEQKSQSMEEKHQIELQAEREAAEHAKTRWKLCGGIAVLLSLILIVMLFANHYRTLKNLALHNARETELENENLKTENELTQERARNAELENVKLKTENELTQERARTAEIEKEKLTLENRNLQLERDNKTLEAENLAHRVETLEGESESLREALESQKEMPAEVRKAIQTRIEMLNTYLASQISDHKEFEKAYDAWVEELTADTEEFMNSNRLALQASHPAFIKYFEDHGLTVSEINYVCLYAIGLRGKDVGLYMKKRSHVNTSSDIRRKLGIDRHETNIGIYVRKLFHDL